MFYLEKVHYTCQREHQVKTVFFILRQILLAGGQTILAHPIISMLVSVIHGKHIYCHDLYKNLPGETLWCYVSW